MSKWIDHIADPVDPEIFLAMVQVWQEAARIPLPKPENPQQGGLYLTDIPMNRGGLAVTGELKKRNVENQQSYLFRIMHMGEIMEAKDRFKDFIKADENDPEAVLISDALLKAAAVAKLSKEGEGAVFDLDDVLAYAKRFHGKESN